MHTAFRRGARIASAATALAIMPITIVAPSAFAAELLSASSVDDTTSEAPSEEPTPQPEPPVEEPGEQPGEEVPPVEETPSPEPGEQPTPPAEEASAEAVETVEEPQVPVASPEAAAPAAAPQDITPFASANPPANTNVHRGQTVSITFRPSGAGPGTGLYASAPDHTRITGINDSTCHADAEQHTVSCSSGQWINPRKLTLIIDEDAPLGVPFTGRIWFTHSGAESGSADYAVTVLPDAPVVSSTEWDANALDYVVTGTGEPDAVISITDSEGTVIATGTVGSTGEYTLHTPMAPGATGSITQSVNGVSGAGTAIAPTLPDVVITDPSDQGTAIDASVSGTGYPGATVTLTDEDGAPVGSALVEADGSWTVPVSDLAVGPHEFTAVMNLGALTSAPATVSFDFAPTAPSAPVVVTPGAGEVGGPDVVFSGTGTADQKVVIRDADGKSVCEATVESNGSWTCDAVTGLEPGVHNYTATQQDKWGQEGAATAIVVSVAPDAVVVDVPAGPVDGSAPITGTGGTPGATIEVRDETGKVIGTGVVENDGSWSVTPDAPLPAGESNLSVVQLVDGVESAPVDTTVSVIPGSVVVDVPAGPVDGSAPITGTGGTPGATIEVRDEAGNVVGTGTVGDDGTWSVTPDVPLPAGESKLSVVQLVDGVESAPVGLSITVESEEVGGPAPIVVTPAPGQAAAGESRVDSSKLANTGAAVMPLVAVAITGLSAGLAFLAAAARRRRRSA